MRIWKVVRNADKYISGFILLCMVAMVTFQIFSRSFLPIQFIGSIDLSQFFLITVVFMAAPFTARTTGHVRMPEIRALLPKKVVRFLRLLSYGACSATFCVVAISAIVTTKRNFFSTATPTLGIPFWLFFLPAILGFTLLTLEYFRLFMNLLKEK